MSKYRRMRAEIGGRVLAQKVQRVEWRHTVKGWDSGYKPVPGVWIDIDGNELTVEDLERIATKNKIKLKITLE